MASDPEMRFRFIRGFFVGVHTAKNPTSEGWLAHCREVERLRWETRGVLVYTEGGGPNSTQRQQLRSVLHGQVAPPTAILTASPVARGIVIGLNWFFRSERIAAFAPDRLDAAFEYLMQAGAVVPHDEIRYGLALMADELGISTPFQTQSARQGSTTRSLR